MGGVRQGQGLSGRGHEGTSWGKEDVLGPNRSIGYIDGCICQNAVN